MPNNPETLLPAPAIMSSTSKAKQNGVPQRKKRVLVVGAGAAGKTLENCVPNTSVGQLTIVTRYVLRVPSCPTSRGIRRDSCRQRGLLRRTGI